MHQPALASKIIKAPASNTAATTAHGTIEPAGIAQNTINIKPITTVTIPLMSRIFLPFASMLHVNAMFTF